VRCKTDENVHPAVVELLRARGHDTVTVWDQGMQGRPDADLAATCRREARALITLDLHFSNILVYRPEDHAGLVVFRVADQSRAALLEVLERALPALEHESLVGRLWIVDERRVRVRGSDTTGVPPEDS
jgi:predicted nuclease of predicted toxin-antitoxin system